MPGPDIFSPHLALNARFVLAESSLRLKSFGGNAVYEDLGD
jgi:hypothetical protein